MLSRFFGERIGGVRFFEELERAKADPAVNYPLLELMHACLASASRASTAPRPAAPRAAADPARSLRDAAPRAAKAIQELSPRWRGQSLAPRRRGCRCRSGPWRRGRRRCCCSALFFAAALLLGGAERRRRRTISALHPDERSRIAAPASSAPPPPPPPPQVSRAPAHPPALAPEIDGRQRRRGPRRPIVIRLCNLVLFAPGERDRARRVRADRQRIAAALEKEPGPIKVVGHTDSAPIHRPSASRRITSSPWRARKAVARLVKQGLIASPSASRSRARAPTTRLPRTKTPEGRAEEPARRNPRPRARSERRDVRTTGKVPRMNAIWPRIASAASGSASIAARRLSVGGPLIADRRRAPVRDHGCARRSSSSSWSRLAPRRRFKHPPPQGQRERSREGHRREAAEDDRTTRRPKEKMRDALATLQAAPERQAATSSTICPGT